MQINVDFLVAGCNTRCRHCYVNGGPGPMMPVDDALLCVEKLDQLAALLPGDMSLTLDHEPMNHPEIGQILHAVSRTKHITNYHHGMTTGIGLMSREDKETVVRSYLENGYNAFGVTIHGSAAHHDEIVRREGAFGKTVAAAELLSAMGCQVQVSLMLNRYFAQDAEEIDCLIAEIGTDDIWLAIPIFTPHANMLAFEPYRATVETFEALRRYLPRWHQNEEEWMERVHLNTIGGSVERLTGIELRSLWAREQQELYLTLHQDCKLYVGNSGAETQYLGDLRMLAPEEAAELIGSLPGNRDYGAFYDMRDIPDVESVRTALERLPQNLVYGDFESVLYRAFVEMGIPTRLIPAITERPR